MLWNLYNYSLSPTFLAYFKLSFNMYTNIQFMQWCVTGARHCHNMQYAIMLPGRCFAFMIICDTVCHFYNCLNSICAACPIEGQRWSWCKGCDGTCRNPNPPCPLICEPGCSCPRFAHVVHKGRCIPPRHCPSIIRKCRQCRLLIDTLQWEAVFLPWWSFIAVSL